LRSNGKWHGSNWIRKDKRLAIYRRDDLSCVYCGATVEDDLMTLDHLIAVELGGTNHESNLVTCCRSCNSAKGKMSVRQFLNFLRGRSVDTKLIALRIRKTIKRKLKK
jgi:5-methylcytosine-specific restriction endonuclease McrA